MFTLPSRAIRQAYLQNGGNDPDVLAQMAQMQAEAQAIEDGANQKPPDRSPRGKQTGVILDIKQTGVILTLSKLG